MAQRIVTTQIALIDFFAKGSVRECMWTDNGIKSQQLKCNTERPLLLAIRLHWSICVPSNSDNKTLRKLLVASFYLAWTHVQCICGQAQWLRLLLLGSV